MQYSQFGLTSVEGDNQLAPSPGYAPVNTVHMVLASFAVQAHIPCEDQNHTCFKPAGVPQRLGWERHQDEVCSYTEECDYKH